MAIAMAAVVVAGSCPVFAATSVEATDVGDNTVVTAENREQAKNSDTAEVEVSVDISSTFTVTIPKHVELQEANAADPSTGAKHTYDATYNVKVTEADIRPDEEVQITVADTLTIEENTSKETVEFSQSVDKGTTASGTLASATQSNEVFTYTLAEEPVKSGSWNGVTNFTITLASK